MTKPLEATDLDAATYISLEGFELLRIDSDNDRWKFIFEPQAQDAMKDFYSGSDRKYRPSEFIARRAALKKLVYQN